jgi:hypothetical protein
VNEELQPSRDISKARHTVATLKAVSQRLSARVQRRLGHSEVETTLGIYAHVLPSMQQDATAKLAALLHGDLRAPTVSGAAARAPRSFLTSLAWAGP